LDKGEIKGMADEKKNAAKVSPLVLIKTYFGLTMLEAKAEKEKLTELDVKQLASAVARERGLTQEDVTFELIPY
jgi:hypothetical protein